jgi:hypothetical protein
MLYHCGCSQGKRAETERASRGFVSRIEARKDGDKEDKKKAGTVLISTISSSFWGQTETRMLKMQPLTCGFSWPVLISAIFSNILSSAGFRRRHTHVGAHEEHQVVVATGMLRPNSSPYI